MTTPTQSHLAACLALAATLLLTATARATVFYGVSNQATLDTRTGQFTLSPGDVPKAIADNTTTSSTVVASDLVGTIADVNVSLDLTHPATGELTLTLISPQGTRVKLVAKAGDSGANFATTGLNDEAATAIGSGTAPFTGSFRPAEPLSAIDGQNPNGTWTLEVLDDTIGNTGTLNSWAIQFDLAPIEPTVFTWAAPASDNWSAAGRWTNDLASGTAPSAAGQPDYTLNFSVNGTYITANDLNAGFLLNQLNFGGPTLTLAGNRLALAANGATLPQINQNSASAVTISNPLSLTADLTVGGTGSGLVAFAGAISGTGAVVKEGPATISLDTANTFSGGLRIDEGTVILKGGGWYGGYATGSGTVTVKPGATLVNWNVHSYGGGNAPMNLLVLDQSRFLLNRETYFGDLTMTAGIIEEYPGAPPGLNSDLRTRANASDGSLVTTLPASVPSEIRCMWSLAPSYAASVAEVADGPAETDLLVSGVVANPYGSAGLTKLGAGTLRFTAVNTYTGTTTVNGGTLALADNAGLKFVVDNTSSNRLAGTGTVVLDGDFTIDTFAVTVTSGSWPLVEVATLTETFGSTFTVAGFTPAADGVIWTKNVGPQNWTFSEATGMLELASESIVTFDFGTLGAAVIAGRNITLNVALGTNVTNLAPTYTLLSGTSCDKPSGTSGDFTHPVVYTVTAEDSSIKRYTVTVVEMATLGWNFGAWTNDADSGISNGAAYTAAINFGGNATSVNGVGFGASASSGVEFAIGGGISEYHGASPNLSGYSVALALDFYWNGNPRTITLSRLTPGAAYETSFFSFGWDAPGVRMLTFGTGSDTTQIDQGFYGNGNGIRISHTFIADATGSKQFTINAVGGGTFHLCALANRVVETAPLARMLSFGPGAVFAGTDIAWNVPYGTNVTALAPTYTLSPGATCDKASGAAQDFTHPQTYRVTAADGIQIKDYTVTVSAPLPFTYTIASNEVTITGYTGPGGAVSIPGTINGLTVTSIGADVFRNLTSLTRVTIPDSVTSIGSYAFSACTGLTRVTLGNGLKSIGFAAFYQDSNLANISLPASLTSIGNWAFSSCTKLTSVTIPDLVTSIGDHAFYFCDGLTNVNIGSGITSIADKAFYVCRALTSAVFTGNAPSLGAQAFDSAASGFAVYFYSGASGFTTPTWQGYPSVDLGPQPLEIEVEQPLGTLIPDGGASVFNGVTVGNSLTRTYTVRNTGTTPLSGLNLSVAGANRAEFSVDSLGSTTLAAGATTTFQVTFTPSTTGPKSAEIFVADDKPNRGQFALNLLVGGGLTIKTYDTTASPSYLSPIANLMAVTPSGSSLQTANLIVPSGAASTTYPGLVDSESYSLLWEGWFDVTKDGPGNYTFGTDSDDGSVIFLDLNNDGDFADPGEMIVDQSWFHSTGRLVYTSTVTLRMDAVRIAIGCYDANGGDYMAARFKKGSGLSYGSLDPINGTSGHFFTARPPGDPAAANLWNFGLAGYPSVINGTNIVWNLPPGTDLASLAPTFGISAGATAVPASGTVANFTTPQTYAVTAQDGSVRAFTVTARISVSDGLTVKTFDSNYGTNYLNPITNLMALTPSGTGKVFGNVEVTRGNMVGVLPGLTGNDTFSVLWQGWLDVSKDGPGIYTFGVESDDGAVIYLDLNGDGDFVDAGELVVNSNYDHEPRVVTGTATLNQDAMRIAIGYYENGSIQTMTARFKKGSDIGFWDLDPISGSSGHYSSSQPPANLSAANLWNFGIPGYPAVTNGTNITLTVPSGTDVASLAPTYTLSTGATCNKPSGSTQNFTAPQTYTVISADSLVTTVYTVTVVLSPAWIHDGSGLWSTTSNWSGGLVADGAGITGDFSSINLTADRTVSLDSARTIGNLIFGDTVPTSAASWLLSNNGTPANILTLAGGTPTIKVNALGTGKDATISTQLAGSAGLTKTGPGTLTLANSNIYTGGTLIEEGVLRLGGTNGSVGTGDVFNYGTLAFNSTANLTVGNLISGSGSLLQEGTGTVVLTGANSYTGGSVIHSGTLQMGAGGTTGSLGTGAVAINSGATLRLLRSEVNLAVPNVLTGAGTLAVAGTGANEQSAYVFSAASPGFVGTALVDDARLGITGSMDNATIKVLDGGQAWFNANKSFSSPLEITGIGWSETIGQLGAIRLSSGANVNGPIILKGNSRITAWGNTGSISGNITESGGSRALEFLNSNTSTDSTITLAGSSNHSGGTTVKGAVVIARSNQAFGTGPVTVVGNGTVARITRLQLENVTINNNLTFASTAQTGALGALYATGGGLSVVNGNVTITSAVGNGGHLGAQKGTTSVLRVMGSILSSTVKPLVRLGTVELGGGGNYPQMEVVDGTLRLAANNGINPACVLTLGTSGTSGDSGKLDLNGFQQTLGGLLKGAQPATVVNNAGTASLLTLSTPAVAYGFSGVIGGGPGSISLEKAGPGQFGLSGSNTYAGVTTLSGGVLSVGTINNGGVAGNLGQATNASANLVLNGGTLQYTGGSTGTNRGMTLSNVSGNGIEVTGSTSTLTVSGILTGSGGFTKSGPGTLSLTGSSTYTGRTTVASGTLRVGSSGLPSGSDVTLAGGILDLAGASPTAKSLAVTGANAVIDFGSSSATNSLRFTNGAAAGWTGNLIVRNFNPAIDNLYFGSSAAGIADNISRIRLDNPVGYPAGSYSLATGANGSLTLAEQSSGDFRYTSNGTAATLTGYSGPGGEIAVPAQLDGLPVVCLGARAFQSNVALTGITLPAGVTRIGDYAFSGCTALANVSLPEGITTIGSYAFYGCTALSSITIPASVASIGSNAFESCTGLTSVTIPANVTSIGSFAFRYCGSLTAITVDAANPTYSSMDGVLFNKAKSVLIQYPGGKVGAYSIPAGVTRIGRSSFYSCTGLTSVTLPASLTTIEDHAFTSCTGLTNVTIPSNVTSIDSYALSSCTNLISAIFLGNAPALGTGVFDFTATGFTVYYYDGRTGFSSPLWQGYPAVSLGAAAPEIAVEQPAGTPLASGSGSVDFGSRPMGTGVFKTFTLKNLGADPLAGIAASLAGPAATDFSISMAPPATVGGLSGATVVVAFSPASGGVRDATLSIASNDADENPFVIRLTGTGTAVPVITAQPLAAQTVAANASVALTVAASGYPAPTFQWYQGGSGDTLSLVEGATAATFTTPALNASTSYWARATNEHGFADSAAAVITVELPPSANPNLAGLVPLFGTLTPAFDPAIVTYQMNLPHEATEITLTPTVAENGAVVTINGPVVASDTPSEPLPLAVGNTVAIVLVAAADGITSKTYVVTFTRAAAVVVSTDPAEVLDATTATLRGTVTPHGTVSAYFEYGPTTDYGTKTAAEEFSGALPLAFNARLEGLAGATPFHYRAVAVGATGPVLGDDVTFTTAAEAPQAATGQPSAVTATSATFQGAVHPKGQATQVHFEYGFTAAYGRSTTAQPVSAGAAMMELAATATDLIANVTYHCRIVATNGAGTTAGADVVFVAQAGTPGGTATQPVAITGAAVGLATDSAILQGGATPNRGTTVAWIEFGITTGYGRRTADQDVGNGAEPMAVSLPADGLLAGTVYHYRLVARNSLGTTPGEDRTFTTLFSPPAAVTGAAEILTRTQARVSGTVRANGAAVEVWFDYGTDGFTFPQSVRGTPATVSGDTNTAVSAELSGLAQGVTYSYRVRAQVAGDSVPGGTESFAVALLSGLIQDFPAAVPLAERQGTVTVNLTPPDIASGWRIQGEHTWRNSGTTATGLVSGDRVLEYRPVPGIVQPESEPLTVVSGAAPSVLNRAYTPAGTPATGRLTATLKPRNSAEAVDESVRLQWRLAGDNTAPWLDSGSTLRDLAPGNYLIECKDIPNRLTPELVSAVVANGKTTAITLTYQTLPTLVGTPPAVLDYETVTGSADRPYAYVGQLRNDTGNGSGFVVRPGVVVTAGHVVFDDGTLSATTGLQWLFQRDRGAHEPLPQLPRGHHLMTGYAAQRALENTPGYASPQSQALDAAALYFLADAGRGGFSGYLASESVANEFLLSPALKTLVGFPVSGIASADRDRMHATPPANIAFAPAFGGTYTTADIRSFGGSSGGPLCVRFENGNYYPAAIYLGGTNQAVVRAIDGAVADLIGFAETSSATDLPGTGGSLTQTGASPVPTEAGILEVFIEPAAARAAGAGWRVLAQAPYQASGTRKEDLDPNTYTVEFATIPGFLPPARPAVAVQAHQMATITFTYEKIILPPVITSADGASGPRNQPLSYQITALNQPDHYQLQGPLPDGMGFDATTGLISGTPTQAGSFVVTVGASNASGAASRTVAIAALPVVGSQSLTAPFNQPLNYQIASSESGDGLTYVAANLPAGLTLNPSSGLLTGTPAVADSYVIPISVTVRSATGHATLTLNITATAPVFTLQPVPDRTISHGAITTLEVAATGQPAPTFQWFEGDPGDTTRPVPESTRATFSTPPLTTATRYWVRASNNSGSAASTAALISVLPSTNPNLAELRLSAGNLSPGFNASIASYAAAVPHAVNEVSVTAVAEVSQTTLTINGVAATLDTPSAPIALAVGTNTLVITATAGDGVAMKTYTLTVTRAPAATAVTGDATAVTDHTATLNGTVTPNGQVTAFFEYGTTTAYGDATPPQDFSGSEPLAVQAPLTGLPGDTGFHYRLVVTSAADPVAGADRSFTTSLDQAVAATGDAAEVGTLTATLVGAVATNGQDTQVYFQLGTTTAYGTDTPVQTMSGASGVTDVFHTATDLVPDTFYHYRFVATNALGTVFGEDVTFHAVVGGGGPGNPAAMPEATTGAAIDLTSSTALLQGMVDPNYGITLVHFEYGLTTAYGSATTPQGVGNADAPVNVAIGITGLQPGKTYHYRLVAENSTGTDEGADATFITGSLLPEVTTGAAEALSATSATLNGGVRARGAEVAVSFEVGTDGTNFPTTVQATPATVGGELTTPVAATLGSLDEHNTYYYRVKATAPGRTVPGTVMSFKTSTLLGLGQDFGRELHADEHRGEIVVSLVPVDLGGWRFVGETAWRPSNVPVAGLATGTRDLEFRPVTDYVQPQSETLIVVSGEAPVVIERFYLKSATPGTAAIQMALAPAERTGQAVPAAARFQWRLLEDADAAWRDSGTLLSGLMPGSYLVECKPVSGWEAPTAMPLVVGAGQTRAITLSYLTAAAPMMNPPKPVPFNKIANDRQQPYAHVGQVRGPAGTYSGFVVKRRVVATVAQAVFDEATLATVTYLQWLPQRENGGYEPDPQFPVGCYIMDDYAAQRLTEASPGNLSLESQNRNVAALYFSSDAGRGGYSGFLASDRTDNEFLRSTAKKTLIGYPTNGVSTANQGRMHASAPVSSRLDLAFDRTFTTGFIRGYGGMAGGPLCVQHHGGAFLPAGIYVGGTTLGTVRAIDAKVVDLFTRAEDSGNGGEPHLGGGITMASFTTIGSATEPGGLKVLIEPAAARLAFAGWRLQPETSYRFGGTQKTGLNPGSYVLEMKPLAGFQPPSPPTVVITGGVLQTVTFDYREITPPPVIASAATTTGTRGFPLVYQISASNGPTAYTLDGTLPTGLVFNSATGLISGTLDVAGVFNVTLGATNSGGTGTLPLALVARPSVPDQRATVALGQPFTHPLTSSESGAGVAYAGAGLPDGVALDATSGVLSGTPPLAGEFIFSISVTKDGATGAALFTLTVTPSPLESWRILHFGTPENTGDAADAADPDRDTKLNLDEYAAGTDPNDPADFFLVLTATKTATSYTVTAAGKAGRTYVLERSTTPGTGPWTETDNSGELEANRPVSLTDHAPPPGTGIYRLRVTAP